MLHYHQITPEERYTLATLRKQVPRLSQAEMARLMERDPSTISRELRRNSTPYDGAYRPSRAEEQANGRRSRSRRNSRFQQEHWQLIEQLLRADLSPEQISGRLRLDQVLRISHENIYQRIWEDKRRGGNLFAASDRDRSTASATAPTRSAAACLGNATSPSARSRSNCARSSATGRWTP
jgi:IS30 family transposase